MAVLQGSMFVASVPMQVFKDKIESSGWTLQQCADSLCSMTLDELDRFGGRGSDRGYCSNSIILLTRPCHTIPTNSFHSPPTTYQQNVFMHHMSASYQAWHVIHHLLANVSLQVHIGFCIPAMRWCFRLDALSSKLVGECFQTTLCPT